MLKKLLENERQYLNHFFENIDVEKFEDFVKQLEKCEGTIFLTGVGKSGLVAEKIAMTMASTGTKAFFLAPTNAMHGDIGILSQKDTVIMLSKSGESDELLHLAPYMRNKGALVSAITCNPHSRLAKAVDFVLIIPHERELCPFDLAPTTSTVIQMIIGDVIAMALMGLKQFTLDQFAKNHPAGRIGRRITMRVKDLMVSDSALPLCTPEDKLVDVLVELSNKRCGCIIVSNLEGHLLGIFTDGDLRRALQKHGAKALDLKMADLMTITPKWVHVSTLAWQALIKMEADQKNPITVLPVLDEDKVVGLIKMHDIVQSGL